MAKESQSVENAIIVAIAVVTAAFVSQWMDVPFDRVDNTIYFNYLAVSMFLVLSTSVALYIKNYPLRIWRSILLTIILWLTICLMVKGILDLAPILFFFTWGLSVTVYSVLIGLILDVNFRSNVWVPWLICSLSVFYGLIDFEVAKFLWVFGMALVPVFVEMYEGEEVVKSDDEFGS